MAIEALGYKSISFTGRQAGIETNGTHNKARIVKVHNERILDALDDGAIPVVAGFQGIDANGDTVNTVSYAERIARGKQAHEALRRFDRAMTAGDTAAMAKAKTDLKADYPYFGYGYYDNPEELVPPVGMTFYAFRLMVLIGGFLLLYLAFIGYAAFRSTRWLGNRLVACVGLASIALVWICSECGWIVAEVGRQPWVIQDLMPTRAAISAIPSSSVITTFWMFAVVFTLMLAAEASIMARYISRYTKNDVKH